MRVPEEILVLTVLFSAAALLLRGFSVEKHRARWSAALVVALSAQFILSGLYWQVSPACLAAALLLTIFLFGNSVVKLRRASAYSALVLLVISAAAMTLLPLFRLPAPTGTFAVATRIIHLVDPVRTDTAFPSGKRELMIQVWYPADPRVEGKLASYRRWSETTLLSSYDAILKTHSLWETQLASSGAPYPLLLFNPAWGGHRTQNTFQMEELASHGFIVAAIDHTHNSLPVAFPGGLVLGSKDPEAMRDDNGKTLEERIAFYNRELAQQTQDDILVLNWFDRRNADPGSSWFRAIDLDRIGALGHSFGGAVSVQTAFQDSRVRVALNMDGWNFGDLANRPLRKPVMFMYEAIAPTMQLLSASARPIGTSDPLDKWDTENVRRTLGEAGGYTVFIRGTAHMNFSDRVLYSPDRKLAEAGPIRPELGHQIINAYTLAFFSETLYGIRQPLLHDANGPYREVTMRQWPTQP